MPGQDRYQLPSITNYDIIIMIIILFLLQITVMIIINLDFVVAAVYAAAAVVCSSPTLFCRHARRMNAERTTPRHVFSASAQRFTPLTPPRRRHAAAHDNANTTLRVIERAL